MALDLSNIKILGLDVDGVMTDGRVIIQDDGQEVKHFHSRDGLGLKFLAQAGIELAIVTGRSSRVVEIRARELGITELHQKVADKWAVFKEILKKRGLEAQQAAFAGDDLVDLPVLCRVGLALAPADACPEALAAAHYVSRSPAGHGAVREMAEFILKGQGLWAAIVDGYKPADKI